MSAKTLLVASGSEHAVVDVVRQLGWEATIATDALTVQNVTRRGPIAAAVLDAALPRGGAQLALKWIRSNADLAAIPVIVLTAEQGRDHVYLDCGAQAVLPLPLNAKSLADVLTEVLDAKVTVPGPPREVMEDATRLAALRASGLLDNKPDEAFDDITRLIVNLLDAPTALLSIVDRDRQFFKSLVGLKEPHATARQTPLSHSFCQWVVSGRDQVVINDARSHPVLKTNLAIRDLGVVAYTGVPIYSADGQALGSLCAIDAKPRQWTQGQIETLLNLAKLVEAAAAHASVLQAPPSIADFDRYVGAAGDAVAAAISLLRRQPLSAPQRDMLLASIERHTGHLVQLNRMIQVSQALAGGTAP